jgi:aminoglycoside phosphotransferase (APT) family kinase protein
LLTRPNEQPVDPVHGDVIKALSPENILPILREQFAEHAAERGVTWRACRAIEALYDPGEHVRIAYALLQNEEQDLRRVWPDGELCYVRYPVRESVSRRGTVVKIGDFNVELYRFPNDRRLRGLRKFAGRDRATRAWQSWLNDDEAGIELQPDTLRRSFLRYVPEQKWIVQLQARCHDGVAENQVKRSIAVRSADVESCKQIYDRVVAMRRARKKTEGLFRVPKPVAMDTNLGLLAIRWVWGDSLLELLQSGDSAKIMRHVAAGLDAFHRTPITNMTIQTPDSELASVGRCADDLAALMPELRHDLDVITDALAQSRPQIDSSAYRTVHNDFHWNQLRGRAERLTILDLERCVLGDPLTDVATFTTQISMLPERDDVNVTRSEAAAWSRAFLDAWDNQTGCPVDFHRVRWHSVVALLTLARGMMRHLRTGWPDLARRCVDRALATTARHDDLEIPA